MTLSWYGGVDIFYRECNARRMAEPRVRMADTMSVDQSLTVRDM
jgi:hypothetical protein